jgi:hypothetical protein
MLDCLYDPQPWRRRAEELRTVAEGMKTAQARAVLLRIAADYDLLAERAEARREEREKATGAG